MATYTMQLGSYIEMFSQRQEGISINDKIEIGRKHLFNFDYPIFDNAYRKEFETNFIKNFYIREIGFETEQLFKMRLETWLNINMGYYNNLFESETWEYDPLQNSNITKKYKLDNIRNRDTNRDLDNTRNRDITNNTDNTRNRDITHNTNQETNTGDNTQTSGMDNAISESDVVANENKDFTQDANQDNFDRTVSSDNPDSRLQLQTIEGTGVIEYASNINEDKTNNNESKTGNNSSDTTSNEISSTDSEFNNNYTGTRNVNMSEGETTNQSDIDNEKETTTRNDIDNEAEKSNRKDNDNENYLEKRFGKTGNQSYPKLIMDYRQALLRVEVQIHKELQQLFMLVY